MKWHTVHLVDVPPSPWKNGGGTTRELLAWPSAQNWSWRMSVAEVESSGPFSAFEGVQRWFAVLAGAGVRLDMGQPPHQHSHTVTASGAPLCFDGGSPAHCSLLGGATQDFNLMLRKGSAQGRMERVSGRLETVLHAPKIIAIYSIAMPARVQFGTEHLVLAAGSLVWRQASAGTMVAVTAEDALWMEIEPCP